MSEVAPETAATESSSDTEAKLESFADEGFHLVVAEAEKFVIEKTHLDGTTTFEGKTLEEVIAQVEDAIAKFPGLFGHSVSRSDGVHEGRDLLEAQAGKPESPEGQTGVTPSAPVEHVDITPAAPAENTGAGANVVAPDAAEPGTPESAAPVDTSGNVSDAEAVPGSAAEAQDTSGGVSDTPGETVTGPVGTPADAPEAQPAPAPEGSVES